MSSLTEFRTFLRHYNSFSFKIIQISSQYANNCLIHLKFYLTNKMKGGYSKNKTKLLPKIPKLISKQEDQQIKEKRLTSEVQKIDQILKSDNLKSLHGFIFTNEIKQRLAQDLLSCISKKHRLISNGFEIWTKTASNQDDFVSKSLVKNDFSFKNQLQRIGFRNVEQYEFKKNGLLSQLHNKHWKVEVIQKKHLFYQERNDSSLITLDNLKQSNAKTPQKRRINGQFKTTNKIKTQISQSPQAQEQITLHKIQKMLNNIKQKLIAIWLPPKSYPQFYGILVASLIKTSTQTVKCRLKKYILFKQAINSKLFQAILDYLSEKYSLNLQKLELIVQKQEYHSYFQRMGCKVASWEGFDKILIIYNRKKEFF